MVVVHKRPKLGKYPMPQLEPAEYSRISLVIDELADVVDDLKESARNFVSDQIERKKQYGERMFLSPKQINWLDSLHNEYVGTAEQPGPKGVDEGNGDPRDRDGW